MKKKCHCCNGTGEEIDVHVFAASMREKRMKTRLSLKDVAGLMEISPAYLCDLELGNRHWSPFLIERFNKVLLSKPSTRKKK